MLLKIDAARTVVMFTINHDRWHSTMLLDCVLFLEQQKGILEYNTQKCYHPILVITMNLIDACSKNRTNRKLM